MSFILTSIQCEPSNRELRQKGRDPVKDPYFWASEGVYTLGDLEDRLFKKPKEGEAAVEDEEKLCLCAVLLTKGFLLTLFDREKIPFFFFFFVKLSNSLKDRSLTPIKE